MLVVSIIFSVLTLCGGGLYKWFSAKKTEDVLYGKLTEAREKVENLQTGKEKDQQNDKMSLQNKVHIRYCALANLMIRLKYFIMAMFGVSFAAVFVYWYLTMIAPVHWVVAKVSIEAFFAVFAAISPKSRFRKVIC